MKEDFLPLELGSSDLILGSVVVGETRGGDDKLEITVHSFNEGGKRVTLHGDPTLGRTRLSLKAMIRALRSEGAGILIELSHMEGKEEDNNSELVPNYLQAMLEQHYLVFEMPMGLPPKRGKEHAIVLKEGSNPISVRPYRYPQVQKDEIQKFVREMLQAGLIQPSSSPFASPVLLVK